MSSQENGLSTHLIKSLLSLNVFFVIKLLISVPIALPPPACSTALPPFVRSEPESPALTLISRPKKGNHKVKPAERVIKFLQPKDTNPFVKSHQKHCQQYHCLSTQRSYLAKGSTGPSNLHLHQR